MMTKTYDEIITLVTKEILKKDGRNFTEIDKDLRLPKGTTLDASGWKDYFDFILDDLD